MRILTPEDQRCLDHIYLRFKLKALQFQCNNISQICDKWNNKI